MTKQLFTLLIVCSTFLINAQERCGTVMITEQMMLNNPEYALARSKVNTQTKEWIKSHPNHKEETIISIPVVVHVVWKTNTQNISNAQIQSQIDILNQDYRRTNIDAINTPSAWNSIAADVEIEFCLAQTDPNGNPTTGINRVQTNADQFLMWGGTTVKDEASAWPNDDYLNIWVCNLGGGILGYATPPSNWISNVDGVVIGYNYFGNTGTVQAPYNKGRTATHEVGHWLNLEHVWGDNNCGNDQVSDTPKQEQENYSCPGFPKNPNSCNTTNSNGDMFMNYMDYTNDACMNLFTNGQKTRMLAAINNYRQNMLNHNLCSVPTSILNSNAKRKELIRVLNILGKETNKSKTNTPLFYIFDDGSVEKRIIIE
ncbi:MAG: zinc metalloprotease [Flavobacteriales bacterium]|nr:zinc metalloprotease [Flavobacteriales bacterium]